MQLIHSLKSRRDSEEGFTLIELMVVVLIIAILIAIAIPTFLGARSRAQNRAAQSDLRNGLTAEKTFYTDNEAYTGDTAAGGQLKQIEPSLDWGGKLKVTVNATADGFVCLQRASDSGNTYAVADIATGTSAGTYYNKTACPSAPLTASSFSGWKQDTTGWN